MGIFKTKKNKRFGYEPRYYKSDKEGSPFEIERKFDKFRKTTGENSGLKGKFQNAWEDIKSSDKNTNKTILIIVFVFLLLFLFIIDFDLSIFKQGLF